MGFKHSLATLAVGAALLHASGASAQPIAPVKPAAQPVRNERYFMTRAMEDYFEGERAGGYGFLGAGVIGIGTSAFLFTRSDDLARGAAYPVVIFGAIHTAVGVVMAIQTSKQIADRRPRIASDPVGYRDAEWKRMSFVMRRFSWLEYGEIALIAAGLGVATYGEIDEEPIATGVGVGLAVQSAVTLGLDFLAERRGARYVNALRDFNPCVSQSGFSLGWQRAF